MAAVLLCHTEQERPFLCMLHSRQVGLCTILAALTTRCNAALKAQSCAELAAGTCFLSAPTPAFTWSSLTLPDKPEHWLQQRHMCSPTTFLQEQVTSCSACGCPLTSMLQAVSEAAKAWDLQVMCMLMLPK